MFFQDAPKLANLFEEDTVLQHELRRRLPNELLQTWEPRLHKLGSLVAMEFPEKTRLAENNPPRHVPYEPFGRRIDEIETHSAWNWFKDISASQGLIAHGYNQELGAYKRVMQTAQLYLFSGASPTASCPLAMADAAVVILQSLAPKSVQQRLLPRLLSKEPAQFITSGQWMTERTGGSDVSNTETVARFHSTQGDEERYTLHGVKWFTSSTTSEMALTLARIEDVQGNSVPGSQGLTLFCVEVNRGSHGELQGILVNRLKDKLGTRGLPTAELTLDGAIATRIGPVGRGVASIASMLNVTRYYNAVASASLMSYGSLLAHDYAARRKAFGKKISEHVLHAQMLQKLQMQSSAALLLSFEVAGLFGKMEAGAASHEEKTALRALIPITKLLLGKQAVLHASDVVECFGGAGYVEDTGIPRLLRDSQVLSIWEGTTNVLSLDVLRAELKEKALTVLLELGAKRWHQVQDKAGISYAQSVTDLWANTGKMLKSDNPESVARQVALQTGVLWQTMLLAESCTHSSEPKLTAALQLWGNYIDFYCRI